MNKPLAQIERQQIRQCDSVRELLFNQQAKAELRQVASSVLTPERMMKLLVSALRQNPLLGKCEPMSFFDALMTCASLGLEPNTPLGHAYLIPFKSGKRTREERRDVYEVQLIIGYKGYISLARRSGEVTSIQAGVHYSDDELWEHENGTDAKLRHVPGPQNGEKRAAWAVAKFRDGGFAHVVLPWEKVIAVRNGSQGWQTAVRFNKTKDTPWGKHEDEMAAKTALRALMKWLPLSTEMQRAQSVDERPATEARLVIDPSDAIDPAILTEGEPDLAPADAGEADDGEALVEGAAPEARPETAPEPKPAAKASTTARTPTPAKADPEPPAPSEINPHQSVLERIVDDLGAANNQGAVEETLAMFEVEIAAMATDWPEGKQTLDEAADAARERLA